MRFQVFLSLWSVTSCSCIDEIPKVAKTKVKPKEIFFRKVKTHPCPHKTAHSNTPPHAYVMIWKYLRNAAQMFTQRKGVVSVTAVSVDAAMSGRQCVFLCESKSTLFGLPRVDAIGIIG